MTLKRKTLVLEDGFRVGVSEVGSGPVPLVFLHGLGATGAAYKEMLKRLADKGFWVIAFDAVNHGRSGSMPWGHSVEDMTSVTMRALDVLKVQKAIFVGHSMGGGMLVEIAARNPHRVAAAILMDAATGQEHHDSTKVGNYRTLAWRAAKKLAGSVLDVVGDGVEAMKLRDAEERLSLLETLRNGAGGLRFPRAAYALMRANTVPLLQAMQRHGVPTAVLHGLHDAIVPYAAGLSTAKLTDATFYAVDGYHSWMLADPELAADLIDLALLDLAYPRRWIQGVS
ncbi:putative haloalkanse dehydrogenase [Mycobacterium phage Pukovnik]|uniref:Haloalkanse dehydrogenase n=1 Tax=Mycobacterium phage Pukovnik TaxID=2914013 RepID=B3VGL1_9CAUD|nr:esterase/lipase [Mycobacterium phage Pukovnik]ACE79988.1 putative haloalkanse dehydrogenase [Mycobacterium phage Pukovnik]